MTYYLYHIQKLKMHKASIWAIKWTLFGDFLVSCGIDGVVFVFGIFSKFINYNLAERQKIEPCFFENWNCISFIKSFYFQGSYRRINWCENFNTFCISSFAGKVFVCKIFFKIFSQNIVIAEKFCLDGFTAEIKDCDFSKNGVMIICCTRDKNLWFWEKIITHKFQCFLILQGHESDIKRTFWHPKFAVIISISYNGFIRIFQKRNSDVSLFKFFNFSDFSLLDLDFDINGNSIFFCSSKGELIHVSKIPASNNLKSKKLKKEKIYLSFFFLSRLSFFALNFSKSNAFFLISGDDETFHIMKNIKIKSQKKGNIYSFKGVKKNFVINLEKSFPRIQFGSINSCIWHPKNENILATCGEDGDIHLWSYLNM